MHLFNYKSSVRGFKMPTNKKIAIIGSGFGGLSAAIRLQAAGFETRIFEKRDMAGGRAYVYREKGFTFDAKDREDYGKLLRNAGKLQKLDKDKLEHAWKYAYIYFIQKQIPLLPTIGEDLYIDFAKLDYLIPGKNKFMDFICEKIIDGKDFILPEELVQLTHVEDKDQIRTYA